jgi:hypothetical protein
LRSFNLLTGANELPTEPFIAATDTVQVENERVSRVILTFSNYAAFQILRVGEIPFQPEREPAT